ncbi:MAG: hypothetical protein R3F11_08475 [Verrucomicrobiales bacterium]
MASKLVEFALRQARFAVYWDHATLLWFPVSVSFLEYGRLWGGGGAAGFSPPRSPSDSRYFRC